MMVTWELLPERWHSRSIFHAGFLLLCLPPIGIASIAALRILPFDAALIRNRLFWPAALVLAVLPLIFILRRLAAASRLMLGILLYS